MLDEAEDTEMGYLASRYDRVTAAMLERFGRVSGALHGMAAEQLGHVDGKSSRSKPPRRLRGVFTAQHHF